MSKELSRRDFLKGAAATAVAAAFGSVVGVDAPKAKAAAAYTPGTYTATATGMGTVTMTATFSEDAITEILLDVSQETEGIGKAAGDTLVGQLMSAQGPEIDGVSGASLTSQAARECLKNCIAQATGTTVSAVVESAAPVEHEAWYDTKYFAKPDPITDIAETIDTDVVVIGAGNGGLVAAASAADLGAKVTLVEKNATWITWAGEMGAYNSKLMNEEYGIHYTDEELLEISNEICRYAGYECDQRLINLWLFNSGRTMDWFVDQMEAKGIHMFLETDMIAGETILMNNHASDSMSSLIARLVRSGIRRDSFRFFDRTEITLATAAAGQGIAVIPASYRVENSALHYVDYASDIFHMEYNIAWNAGKNNQAVRLFLDEVQKTTWPCIKILSDQ